MDKESLHWKIREMLDDERDGAEQLLERTERNAERIETLTALLNFIEKSDITPQPKEGTLSALEKYSSGVLCGAISEPSDEITYEWIQEAINEKANRVLCKDCKHYFNGGCEEILEGQSCGDDFFCKRGERRQ